MSRPMMPTPVKPMFIPAPQVDEITPQNHIKKSRRLQTYGVQFIYHVTYDMSSKACLGICCQVFPSTPPGKAFAFYADFYFQSSGKVEILVFIQ
jgi:hypothetical protein